ncbi:MAG: SIS domain-containing protein [Desulfobaccales bacterium]|nr:SIS domain-containing protein [Desulfobaccales bacterium]
MPIDIKAYAANYFAGLKATLDAIAVTDRQGNPLDFFLGMDRAAALIRERTGAGNKLMFIGNGASAAISSHMATDFWKNGDMRAVAFNDGVLLTCISNDWGYEQVFAKPIDKFADPGDILIAISSSGQSPNILRGVEAARRQGCSSLTLSGFKPDNPLRSLGDYNFYVPANQYGPVEILHHAVCHCILEAIIMNE